MTTQNISRNHRLQSSRDLENLLWETIREEPQMPKVQMQKASQIKLRDKRYQSAEITPTKCSVPPARPNSSDLFEDDQIIVKQNTINYAPAELLINEKYFAEDPYLIIAHHKRSNSHNVTYPSSSIYDQSGSEINESKSVIEFDALNYDMYSIVESVECEEEDSPTFRT